jgi:mitogen-activated protein kinase kinase 7
MSGSKIIAKKPDAKQNEIKVKEGYLFSPNEKISFDKLEKMVCLGPSNNRTVYKMKHEKTEIAVKTVRIKGEGNCTGLKKSFIKDLEVLQSCNDCKNIVKFLGYFELNNDFLICMELMTMCFDKLLKVTKPVEFIPVGVLGMLSISTLNALQFLKKKFEAGTHCNLKAGIHGNLKPSNLLINKNGEIKLSDFITPKDQPHHSMNLRILDYMAPEISNPAVHDARADIWSLGIILFELSTGKCPILNNENEFDMIVDLQFKDFLTKCLTKDVNKRSNETILLQHPFIATYKIEVFDVKKWFDKILVEKKDEIEKLEK